MTMAMSCHDNKHHQQFSSSSPSSIHSNSNAINYAMEGGQQGQYSLLKDRWNHIHQQTLVEQNELMKYFMKSMEDIWNKQNNDVQRRIFFSNSKDEIDNESSKSSIIKDDCDNKGLLLIPRLVTTRTTDASSPGSLNNSSNRSHQFAHQGNTKELSPVRASSPSSTKQQESTTKTNDIEYKMERMILKEQLKKQRKEIEELKIKLLKARNANETMEKQNSTGVTDAVTPAKGTSSNITYSPKSSKTSSSSVRSRLHDSRNNSNSNKMNQSQPIAIDNDSRVNDKGVATTAYNSNSRRSHTSRQSRRHSDVVVPAPISPTESNKSTTKQKKITSLHKETSCDNKKHYDALEEKVLLKATKLKKSAGTNKYHSSSRSSSKSIKNRSNGDGRADDPLNKTWHGSRGTAGMKKLPAPSSLSSRHHLDKLSDNINQVSSDIRNLHRLQKTLMHNRRNSLDMNDEEKHKKKPSSSGSRANERFGKSLDIGLLMTEPSEENYHHTRKPDGSTSMTFSSTISSGAFRNPVASTSSSSMKQSSSKKSSKKMDETMKNNSSVDFTTLNLSSNSLDLEHEVLDNNTNTSDQTTSFHQSTSTTTTSTQGESSSLELMLHSYSSGDKKQSNSYNDLHQTCDNNDEEEEEDHDDGNDDEEEDSILLALKQDQDLLFMESQSTAHLYNESMSSFHRADSGNSSSIISSQRGRRSHRRNHNNNDDDNTTISDDTLVKNIAGNLGRSGSLLLHDHDDVLIDGTDEVPNTYDRVQVDKQKPVQDKQDPILDKQDTVLRKGSDATQKPAQPRRGSLSGGNRSGLIQKRKLLSRLKRRNVTADLA